MRMKTLGVIGGLGPMATAYFLQLVTQMTAAETDQEHIEILVHSRPGIPDRTGYILGRSSDSPLPDMIATGRELISQGAEILAIPCITAHYFQRQLEEAVNAPIINAVRETAVCLERAKVRKVGLMATDGTIESGLFQRALSGSSLETIIPDKEHQAGVMHLIYQNVKAGLPVEYDLFEEIAGRLFAGGAEVVLLGCTELSLIKRDFELQPGFLDVMEVLAREAVLSCGRLKSKYMELITGRVKV